MTAALIDGVAVSKAIRAQWQQRVGALKARGVTPGLAVILVGDNPASQVYVRNKVRACGEVGLYSEVHPYPAIVSQETVLAKIEELNQDPKIHGILVQLHQDAVDLRILIQFFDLRQHRLLRNDRGIRVHLGIQPDFAAGPDLVSHVDLRSGIVADQDHRQPRGHAARLERSDALLPLRADRLRNCDTVDEGRGHAVTLLQVKGEG